MKKLLAMLIVVLISGCFNTPKQSAKNQLPIDQSADAAAVQKQLPMVDPQSITNENGLSKAKELQDELLQESKRMAAARGLDGPH